MQVWDLSEEEVHEEMAASPEAWIQQQILDPKLRVILGKKETLSQVLYYNALLMLKPFSYPSLEILHGDSLHDGSVFAFIADDFCCCVGIYIRNT
jgi:hypothetical protein